MGWIDITVPIRDRMVVYEGDPEVHVTRVRSIDEGAGYNLTRLDMGAHSGTHADAPVHFIAQGGGAETIPQELLNGPAIVADATAVEGSIGARALSGLGLPDGTERLLLKTRNSRLWDLDRFSSEFVSLDRSGAEFLVDKGIHVVGLDYLSIGDEEAHHVLLGNGVTALESLDLRSVAPGHYTLHCLTLAIVGSDGAPARALLEPAS